MIKEPGIGVQIPVEEIEKTRTAICNRVEYSKQSLANKRAGWARIYRTYTGMSDYTTPFGVKTPEARIHTPTMAMHIDRLVQQLTIRLVQPFENFIEARLRSTKERVYKIENFLFDMFKRNNFAIPISSAVQSAALYGVGITKVIPNGSSAIPDCVITHVPLKYFHPDPFALGINNCAFIVEEFDITYDEFIHNYRAGHFNIHSEVQRLLDDCHARNNMERLLVDSLTAVEVSVPDSSIPSPAELRRAFGRSRWTPVSADFGEEYEKFDRIKLYEYHDRNFVLLVANGKYLIKAQKVSMGYPYQAWYLRLDPEGKMFPISHGELIVPIAEEIDVKRNQRVENINKLLDPPLLYTPTATTKIQNVVLKSGEKIPVNSLDGFKFLEFPNATDLLFNEGNALKGEVSEITGVTGVIVGAAAKGERMTRQEASAIYTQSAMPFDYASSVMVLTGLIPMLRHILLTCSVIGKEPPMVANTPTGVGAPEIIFPSEMANDYDLTFSVNPNKESRDKQEALEIFQILSQSAYVDQVGLLRWILPRLSPDAPRDIIVEQPAGQIIPGKVSGMA